MKTLTQAMQCPNPQCLFDENPLGQQTCSKCETPLLYRYLGALGRNVGQIKVGEMVGDRYLVTAPQTWLDLRPTQNPEVPADLPASAMPYLHLYPYRLYVPLLHGFYQGREGKMMLLENIPVDTNGKTLPTLAAALRLAKPVRQVYWLWQMLDLWTPLQAEGVASSLLISGNLRVEGWRLRLRSLFSDADNPAGVPQLKDLGTLWQSWLEDLHPDVAAAVVPIVEQMQTAEDTLKGWQAIAHALNLALLQQSAQQPFYLSSGGATSAGPQHFQNEDSCYPGMGETFENDPLLPRVAIICDGIGGHAGGEVASQLAVRSLQLQIRALLPEIADQTEPQAPDLIAQQLEAMVRVVNNLIASQNDTQGRSDRQRMGTTLVLALQVGQAVQTPQGERNARELYLVHIGDSRAYWLTLDSCTLLTVDDDWASRQVRAGYIPLWQALRQTDAGALTQALGTRDADLLYPTVQRFIVEEDGVLLLCSDGVSDRDLVEKHWQETTRSLLAGTLSPQAAAQSWVKLADAQNGHDNASAVVTLCLVSREAPQIHVPPLPGTSTDSSPDSELSEAAKALLYDDVPEPVAASEKPTHKKSWAWAIALILFLLTFGSAAFFALRYFQANTPQQLPQQENGQG